ncbi:peptidylprolyl isomerase [Acidobacteriota bacterium]
MKKFIVLILVISMLPLMSCRKELESVTVQHILISFKGADPRIDVERTREEAKMLARQIFERAKSGETFDALVKEYTDDSHPGIYTMKNFNFAVDSSRGEFKREKMVKAFGDVSFKLKIGEIGMTEFNDVTSKYGWHIIKRIE